MNTPNTDIKTDNELNKEFWDSLQAEIFKSKRNISTEDIFSYVEKGFMFSLLSRGTSHKELNIFKSILKFKDLGYLILFEFLPKGNTNIIDFDLDELNMYHFIKDKLKDLSTSIGPMINNRFTLLVTGGPEDLAPGINTREKSISVASRLISSIENEYQIKMVAGIGNAQSIHSIYTSFLEALSCIRLCNPGEIKHVQNLDKHNKYYIYEYQEAEDHRINAILHNKADAYDYFLMMMNQISQLNDIAKRNKIIEALVLATHASRIDGMEEVIFLDYTSHFSTLMVLNGNQLIEWAFQKFVDITEHVKKHNVIDYSRKIVQANKEYLESHYSDEIA